MTATGIEHLAGGSAHALGELPTDRVVQVRGASAENLALELARGTPDLPMALVHRMRAAVPVSEFVTFVLDGLEAAAIGLFPAWLPGAEHIQASGAGLVAVWAVATAHASKSGQFGPFLSDLAATALDGKATRSRRFQPEIRAVGLARAVTNALRRQLLLVLDVPAGLGEVDEQVAAAGCGWLADRGRIGVWLAGAPLRTVDWFPTALLASATIGVVEAVPSLPAAVGAPHPRSTAEVRLEAALAAQPWAAGRRWNQSYQSHRLCNPVRLDLLWPVERCVVEIDGLEHCEPVRFDADRRRDVQLQLDGYAVLRFTNTRVLHDVGAVVTQIGQFLDKQRREFGKGQHGK